MVRNDLPLAATLLCLTLLSACGSGGGSSSNPSATDRDDAQPSPETDEPGNEQTAAESGTIRLNQLGFYTRGQKLAIVPEVDADEFLVRDARTNETVFSGELSPASHWAPAGASVRIADFSRMSTPGSYTLSVSGLDQPPSFSVTDNPFRALNRAALKAYYFNRAGTALDEAFAAAYARPLAHPDEQVLVHRSAASGQREPGETISAPKGWYDAGDFGKYVVNSGISTYPLLAAYEHFPDYYNDLQTNIPESVNQLPDILDEARWNLDWMLAMQAPDGGVYHKLTSLNFAGALMPHESDAQRYVIGKSTSASLNFAAVMAVASRIWQPFDPEKADTMLSAARAAWDWAQNHPERRFTNPEDVHTGVYGGNNLASNCAWAAAELFITTANTDFYAEFAAQDVAPSTPSWANTGGLAWTSLAFHNNQLPQSTDRDRVKSQVVSLADTIVEQDQHSGYRLALSDDDFFWGSNSGALNKAMMLLQAYRLEPDKDAYINAATSLLDYVLGRNPTGFSYVTQVGNQSPLNIHHRASQADANTLPVPGSLAGGPTPHNQEDDCGASAYPSSLPALSYLDDWCSFSTNEVAINWNAPLVYVSGALEARF